MQENWRPVVGYEGYYEVSDQGRVRSLDRLVESKTGQRYMVPGRVMSVHGGDTYAKVRFRVNGLGRTHNVHVLVAAAFLGPRPAGLEVCHNNGQHQDNRVENLRYDTRAANIFDRRAHGTAFSRRDKSECYHGHPYVEGSFYVDKDSGKLVCHVCSRERGKRRNAAKTSCKKGHPLDGRRADGQRFCLECARNAWATHRERASA